MDIKQYMNEVGQRARHASRAMAKADTSAKNKALSLIAAAIRRDASALRAANQKDLDAARANGLAEAMLDRLTLSDKAIATMAEGLEQIVALADPIGEISNMKYRPSGIQVGQMRVPLGVIGIIYEARPNVTVDAAGLCVKSGNAVILRGGKEATHSNTLLTELLRGQLSHSGLPADAVQSVPTLDREAVGHLLKLNDYIDLTIPRGGEGLIRRVTAEATMPVLKHFQGNCHVYVDEAADLDMAIRIIVNAKCQRPGTCNAAESVLVHAAIADQFLPALGAALKAARVEIRGCAETCKRIPDAF